MNFGDFLENNSCGARIVTDLSYSNTNTIITTTATTNNNNSMAAGAIAQPRHLSISAKPMFNSPALSLALVRTLSLSLCVYIYVYMCVWYLIN